MCKTTPIPSMLYLLFFLSIFLNHSAPIVIFTIHPILILFFIYITTFWYSFRTWCRGTVKKDSNSNSYAWHPGLLPGLGNDG